MNLLCYAIYILYCNLRVMNLLCEERVRFYEERLVSFKMEGKEDTILYIFDVNLILFKLLFTFLHSYNSISL